MRLFCHVFSAKIVLHLSPPEADKGTGPVTSSKYAYIRLSFKERGEQDVSSRNCLTPTRTLPFIHHSFLTAVQPPVSFAKLPMQYLQ